MFLCRHTPALEFVCRVHGIVRRRLELYDDFAGREHPDREILGFEVFVTEPEDIEAGFVSSDLLLLFFLVAATRLEDTKHWKKP